jgi:hypothetical protein
LSWLLLGLPRVLSLPIASTAPLPTSNERGSHSWAPELSPLYTSWVYPWSIFLKFIIILSYLNWAQCVNISWSLVATFISTLFKFGICNFPSVFTSSYSFSSSSAP